MIHDVKRMTRKASKKPTNIMVEARNKATAITEATAQLESYGDLDESFFLGKCEVIREKNKKFYCFPVEQRK